MTRSFRVPPPDTIGLRRPPPRQPPKPRKPKPTPEAPK
jgi:hypothetical protein